MILLGLIFQAPIFFAVISLWMNSTWENTYSDIFKATYTNLIISTILLGGFILWCFFLKKLNRERLRISKGYPPER